MNARENVAECVKGALDFVKLASVSREVIGRMSVNEIYELYRDAVKLPKRDFTDMSKFINNLEMRRLSWVTWRGSVSSQGFS